MTTPPTIAMIWPRSSICRLKEKRREWLIQLVEGAYLSKKSLSSDSRLSYQMIKLGSENTARVTTDNVASLLSSFPFPTSLAIFNSSNIPLPSSLKDSSLQTPSLFSLHPVFSTQAPPSSFFQRKDPSSTGWTRKKEKALGYISVN